MVSVFDQVRLFQYNAAMIAHPLPTLLAPVGSMASLQAALQAGADAVYFGVGPLNMRMQNATNFSPEELEEVVARAKEYQCHAYMTLNTIIYDDELAQAKALLARAKRIGVDAVIVADMAALTLCRDLQLEAHLSTQASVSNLEAVRFYSQWVDRIVLARELTLEQIKAIIHGIKEQDLRGPRRRLVEIELFAHGAMCVAVSGRCAMSLYHYNRSANRGECIQPCRRSYRVIDEETGKELIIDNHHVMSPRDLNTLPFLDQLVASGPAALKIEGRTRSPEYVATVVAAYREALEAIARDQYTQALKDKLMAQVSQVYHRGFSDGFYLGYNPDQWAGHYGSQATHRKQYCAKVLNYYPQAKVAHLLLEACDLALGDDCLVIGPTTGVLRFKLSSLRVNEREAAVAKKGEEATITVPAPLRLSDKLYVMKKV